MRTLRAEPDINMEAASALEDLALVHSSRHGRIAYKRAARAVLTHARPLSEVTAKGGLREIPYIGPASERVILEVLEHGSSPTAERAVAQSGLEAKARMARQLRANFLSRARVIQILEAKAPPGVVGLGDYRGDLQMHTRWSDGAATIAAMAKAASQRGHAYAAITDHSYGLPIAGGISMEEAHRQQREIDALNQRSKGFRVLKGIEANIRADGGLDMTADELRTFEVVVAAPHSLLRRAEDQTPRMLAAVRHPDIHVLAHPRGRMRSRPGIVAHWDEVFEAAARLRVAVELDGDWYRQDLDFTLAQRALRVGCLFALDSDAHAPDQLSYSEYALAHARLAGIPAERVVNTWPLEDLLAWLSERRPSVRPRASSRIQPAPG
jgi:putative hydrolase